MSVNFKGRKEGKPPQIKGPIKRSKSTGCLLTILCMSGLWALWGPQCALLQRLTNAPSGLSHRASVSKLSSPAVKVELPTLYAHSMFCSVIPAFGVVQYSTEALFRS